MKMFSFYSNKFSLNFILGPVSLISLLLHYESPSSPSSYKPAQSSSKLYISTRNLSPQPLHVISLSLLFETTKVHELSTFIVTIFLSSILPSMQSGFNPQYSNAIPFIRLPITCQMQCIFSSLLLMDFFTAFGTHDYTSLLIHYIPLVFTVAYSHASLTFSSLPPSLVPDCHLFL